ncbi:MAG: SDR family NAD(P)-dependent oxidoreductase [Planctomycetota bacterium]
MSAGFRAAYVTGASSGLGAEIARQLAARGTRVVLAARRVEALEALAAELRAAGGAADAAPVDVADADAVRAEVARWDDELELDLVLANAGVSDATPAHSLRWEHVEPVLRVNALGAVATLHAGLERMLPRGRGTLAGMSSLAAYRGLPGSGAYAASKACLSTFLETLRSDLAGTGVRAVDLRPGFVRTPMTDGARFPMPFLMDVEPAAKRCVRALLKGEAIAAFPPPMWLGMGVAQSLPNALWRGLARLLPRTR